MNQVIIVGGGAKARCFDYELARQPGVEIWGINRQKKDFLPHTDRMFNLHRYQWLKKYGWPCFADGDYVLMNPHIDFVVVDLWPDNRMSRAEIFPREKIAAAFPNARNDYHCNSCDWLIAYALYEGFEAIHLHGMTLARDGMMEQMSARACAEYWMGFAEGRGVKVILAEDSDLCVAYHLVRSNRVYGYDDCPAFEDRVTGKDPPYRYDDY